MRRGRGRRPTSLCRNVPRHARRHRGAVRQGRRRPGVRRAVPAYAMPEDAVRALAAATRYGEWRARDRGERVAPAGIDRARGRARSSTRCSPGRRPAGRWLAEEVERAARGTTASGSGPPSRWPRADEAVAAAERARLPGGAQVDRAADAPPGRGRAACASTWRSEASVREAFAALSGRLAPLAANSFVVQRMADAGRPVRRQHHEDPLFGPVVELQRRRAADRAARRHRPPDPAADRRRRLRPDLLGQAAPLLHGHRGAAPVHRGALADLIARVVGAGRQTCPRWRFLVLNPVNAHPGGVDVLGAEVRRRPGLRAQGHRSPGAARSAQGWRGWAPPPMTRRRRQSRHPARRPDPRHRAGRLLPGAGRRRGRVGPGRRRGRVPPGAPGDDVRPRRGAPPHHRARPHHRRGWSSPTPTTTPTTTTSPTTDATVATATTESVPLIGGARGDAHPRRRPTPRTTSPGRSAARSPSPSGWGAVSRLDLVPATCADPDCEADHGYEGSVDRRRHLAADQRRRRRRGRPAAGPDLRPRAVGDASAALSVTDAARRRSLPMPPAVRRRPALAGRAARRCARSLGVPRRAPGTPTPARSSCRRRAPRGGRPRRRPGLRAARATRRARAVPALAARRRPAGSRPASRRRRRRRWAPSAPACRRARTGCSATRCSCPARTGCSTSCPGRTARTRAPGSRSATVFERRRGRRGRGHPGRAGLLRRLGADRRRPARRPVRRGRHPRRSGSTRRSRPCASSAACAGLPLLGRARQGRPRARLPVLGVGRRARGDRRRARAGWSRSVPERHARSTSPPTTAWSTPRTPCGSTWPTTPSWPRACGTSAASRAPCSSTARPGRAADVAPDLGASGWASGPGSSPARRPSREGWFGPVSDGQPGRGSVTSSSRCADNFAIVDSRRARPQLLALLGLHGSLTRRGGRPCPSFHVPGDATAPRVSSRG